MGGGKKWILSIHFGFSLGGVAKYAKKLERICEGMDMAIHSVCILTQDRAIDALTMSKIDHTEIVVDSVWDFSWLRKVRSMISEKEPTFVMSHGFNGHLVNFISCVFQRNFSLQIASYHGGYHATTLLRKSIQPLYNGFTHWFLRNKVASVVCVADYCTDFLRQHGVPPEKLATIHNGIKDHVAHPDSRRKIRGEWGIGEDHLLIGIASRLDPVKGLAYLMEAFAVVAGKHDAARLVLLILNICLL